MNIKKILVLGGAGFLGSHVADALSRSGYLVKIFDKTHSPYIREDQEMILGNILDYDAVNDAVKEVDVVYNFAAISDLNDALNKPIETTRVNVLGNTYVLEACKNYQIRRYVYASTLYVYSNHGSFYRCSKQAAETFIEEYHRLYNLNYTILRYGSLYGSRSNVSNGVYRMVKEALENRVLRYSGDPEAVRDYIHVEDAATSSAYILADEFSNESVILTGRESIRVVDLLKIIAEILDLPQNAIEFLDMNYPGHYKRTPYSFQPKFGKKYTPDLHIDLGQGLLKLIEEICHEREVVV